MQTLLAVLSLLGGVVGATSSRAPSVEARTGFNDWKFEAKPGALVAMRSGREVWRRTGPLAAPTSLNLWATTREVLMLSREWRSGIVVLSAYALETGKPLWTNRVYDRWANADARFSGVVGRTVLLSAVHGEPMVARVLGVSLDTGKTLWEARQDLVGFTATEALVLNPGLGAEPMNSPHLLPLTRVKIATGQQTKLTLTLPTRPGCGPMNYQDHGGVPDLRFTNRYLYALRQDACGRFVVRLPWQGALHTPMVYPDRRPPTPPPIKFPETP